MTVSLKMYLSYPLSLTHPTLGHLYSTFTANLFLKAEFSANPTDFHLPFSKNTVFDFPVYLWINAKINCWKNQNG